MSSGTMSSFGNKKDLTADFAELSYDWNGWWKNGLVKLVWDYRVLDQKFEGDDLEGGLVGGFENRWDRRLLPVGPGASGQRRRTSGRRA